MTVSSPSRNPDSDVVFQYRGIAVVNVAEAQDHYGNAAAAASGRSLAPPAVPSTIARPVKVAALDNNGAHFTGLKPTRCVDRGRGPDR